MIFQYLTIFLDSKATTNLYYRFIYPHLLYGTEFWGHAPDYLTSKILINQKKAFRIITVLKEPPKFHVLHKFSGLKIMPVSRLFEFRLVFFIGNTS